MNAPATEFPRARVVPHLGHALGGIWRLTLRRFFSPNYWLMLAAALAVLGLLAFAGNHEAARDVAEGRGYLKWMVDFYLTFVLPIIAFITAAGALRDELRPDSVDYMFTRPVPRPAFVVGKFLAHVVCAQFDYLLALAVLLGVGVYKHIPDLFAAVPLLLVAQVLMVTVFSAFGFLFGLLTPRYVVIGLCYGLLVEIGVGQIPTQLNRLSMIHQVRAMFPMIILRPDTVAPPPAASPVLTAAILLAMTLFLLTATALAFSLKELAGVQGKET
jgi:ABC-2 type transport system permease protein